MAIITFCCTQNRDTMSWHPIKAGFERKRMKSARTQIYLKTPAKKKRKDYTFLTTEKFRKIKERQESTHNTIFSPSFPSLYAQRETEKELR